MMDVNQESTQLVLRVSKYWVFITHLIPSIAVVLLLLLDFQAGGRFGFVNKPYRLAAITPLVGIAVGLLVRSIDRKPSSFAIWYVVHFVVSILVILLFFAVFVKDSL